MKTAMFLALALVCGGASAEETMGGTLHGATLREWYSASPGNQFATVSDIVERVLNVSDHASVAPKVRDVQACISRVSANFTLRSQTVFDTAFACMAELGYLPRL